MSELQVKHRSAVAWFEIPSRDLNRAQRFYETILGCTMKKDDFGDHEDEMCIFPAEQTGVSGALIKRSFQRPGSEGTMVYLSCDGKLDAAWRINLMRYWLCQRSPLQGDEWCP